MVDPDRRAARLRAARSSAVTSDDDDPAAARRRPGAGPRRARGAARPRARPRGRRRGRVAATRCVAGRARAPARRGPARRRDARAGRHRRAAAALRAALPETRVLIVTTFGRPGYLRRAMQAGRRAASSSRTPRPRQLADAVRRVHAGPAGGRPGAGHRQPGRRRVAADRRARPTCCGPRATASSVAAIAAPAVPVRGHGAQPPVRGDRQDRRRQPGRGGADRRRQRLAVGPLVARRSSNGLLTQRQSDVADDHHQYPDHDPATASQGRRRGWGVHQTQATTNSASHTTTSSATAHQAATPAVPRSRKSTHAEPDHPGERQRRDPRRRRRRRADATAAGGRSSLGGTPLRLAVPAGLVVPVRVVVPLLVALLGLLQGARGLLRGGVGAEPVDRRAAVRALDAVVLHAEPVLAMPVSLRRQPQADRRLDTRRVTAIAPAAISPRRAVPASHPAAGVRRPAGARRRSPAARSRTPRRSSGCASPAGSPRRRRELVGAHVAPGRHHRRARPDRPRVPLRPRRLPVDARLPRLPQVAVHERQRGRSATASPTAACVEDGDIVNIDITAFLDGVHGDTNATFLAGDVDEEIAAARRAHPARRCDRAIKAVKPGPPDQRDRPGHRVLRQALRLRRGPRVHRPRHRHARSTPAWSSRTTTTPRYDDVIEVGHDVHDRADAQPRHPRVGHVGRRLDRRHQATGRRSAQFEHTLLVTARRRRGPDLRTSSAPSARDASVAPVRGRSSRDAADGCSPSYSSLCNAQTCSPLSLTPLIRVASFRTAHLAQTWAAAEPLPRSGHR